MWADMMDTITARDQLNAINVARAGQGDDKKNSSWLSDLRRRARLTDPWDDAPQAIDMTGVGLTQVQGFSTDEAYIDDDEWFGDTPDDD